MANRSYVFLSQTLPSEAWDAAQRAQLHGVCEHAYAVPLLQRLLVSADSRLISSAIWQQAEPLAIAGRAQAGMERALQFLQQIQHPHIEPFRQEAEHFLRSHIREDDWLILEAAEVLEMQEPPSAAAQVRSMLDHMPALNAECAQAVEKLRPQAPNFWQKIFKPSQESLEEPLRELGLGNWSENLYFSWDDSTDEDA